jgi:PKD repeat protein
MRKLYTLVTGLLFLVTMKTIAQSNISHQQLISDPGNNSFINTNYFSTENNSGTNEINSVSNETEVTCKADFEINPTPNSLLYKKFTAVTWNSEQKNPVYICWKFGDGKDTCIQYSNTFPGPYTVVHHYQQPGTYEVCVRIVYEGGCEAKNCKQISIPRPDECKADFEKLNLSTVVSPLYVSYKALPWNSNNKKPRKICWQFGDGKDTCIEYPENFTGTYLVRHHYREVGLYQVCIAIWYYGGCEAKTCKPVQIGRRDECKADFEKLPVTNVNNVLNTTFKALPWNSNYKKPKTICWRFGDGKDTCIQYPENFTGIYAVKHEYREPGTYEVCVKISYFGGCEAYNCKKIIVGRPDECKADFERLPLTSNYPLSVYYKAFPIHNNDKKPKQICWKFGDGRDTCIEYPENFTGAYVVKHEYHEPGDYEVCVKISYFGGCEAYNCKKIIVSRPDECKADFEKLQVNSTSNPLLVYYKAIPSHNNNKKPKQICWRFGDGKDTCIVYGEDYTGTYAVSHHYNAPGTFEVCLKILYYGGCEAYKCEKIIVDGPSECHVKLYELTPSITSLVRGFYAIPGSSNNKRPLLVCWYFGDGKDTCIQFNNTTVYLLPLIIRHTYPAPGVYRACVKILFDGGCIAYDCTEVVIRPTTNACGGYMTDSLLSPRTVKFNGFAIHNPNDPVIGFNWTFGDGSSTTGREVTHSYNVPGTYEVCLTIKTQYGCETKICKKLIVPGNTQPVIHISPNPVENMLHLLFYSTHSEPVNIRIVNANGVIVRNYLRNATTGANNWDFDVTTLTPGSYMLYIQSPNQLSSQLFIKQ